MPSSIVVRFGPNAKKQAVSDYSMRVITDILQRAGLSSATISSTTRSPADQARAMYANLENFGVKSQKKLYAAAGDAVIDVYSVAKTAMKTPMQIKAAMEAKIIEIGPQKVSHHAADPLVLCVVDIAPSSIANKFAFETIVRSDGRISKFITPPDDPGYHLEIPQI